MIRFWHSASLFLLLFCCIFTGSALQVGATAAKTLFGSAQTGSDQAPSAFGSYAKGCLAGAEQLAESGPTWQAMRLSRNRNWGHPETIDYIQKLSQRARNLRGWNGLYIGDISQPRGGPMLSGHASHQNGLDVDIWLRRADDLSLSPAQREEILSTSLRRAQGAYINDKWTGQHLQLLKYAAQDPRVARIFIFPGAKVKMCKQASGDRAWLRKIRPWWGHHSHFHVRLKCPAGLQDCVNQPPPPKGDGCKEAEKWVARILNPPKVKPKPPGPPRPKARPKPKRALQLADLPGQCRNVLNAK